MKAVAIVRPYGEFGQYQPYKIILTTDRNVHMKTVKTSKKGCYFIHRGRRNYFTYDPNDKNGNINLLRDPENVTIYLTISKNYTATIQSDNDGDLSLKDYLDRAVWGQDIDENFGRITFASGGLKMDSILAGRVRSIVWDGANKLAKEHGCELSVFYGKTERMRLEAEMYRDKPKAIKRHKDVLWSI